MSTRTKSFRCKRCGEDSAFSILENILAGNLVLLTTVLFFSTLLSYLTLCERIIAEIELAETIMTAKYALFQFSRYSSSANILATGKRLRLGLTHNGIEIYPTGKTLVVFHKGVANPLAEGCGEQTKFFLEKSQNNREILKAYIPFDCGSKSGELSLEVGIYFWQK